MEVRLTEEQIIWLTHLLTKNNETFKNILVEKQLRETVSQTLEKLKAENANVEFQVSIGKSDVDYKKIEMLNKVTTEILEKLSRWSDLFGEEIDALNASDKTGTENHRA